jgi:hypothetical protein
MADYEDFFVWRHGPIGDPIGPWVQVALDEELIDSQQAANLTVTQVGLQKEAIALQRRALDLQEKALDAIAESAGRDGQT